MKLLLTVKGPIPPFLLRRYNRIAHDLAPAFSRFIDSISATQGKNYDWHFSGPASRNVFTSPLFVLCSKFALLQNILLDPNEVSEQIDTVETDSKIFKRIISLWLRQHGLKNIRITGPSLPFLLQKKINAVVRAVWVLFFHLLAWAAARITNKTPHLPEGRAITLIDTFAVTGYLDRERYYPGLLEMLPETERKDTYFVPTLYRIGIGKLCSTYRKLRSQSDKFLFKEDFLTFRDYLFSWAHLLRRRHLYLGSCTFLGCDLAPLLLEEITGNRELNTTIISFHNHLFAKRLRERGVRVRLTINWFENQPVDKGWNSGFGSYFPNITKIGYLGFVPPHLYLCAKPTPGEKNAGLLPDLVAVTGPGVYDMVREYCPDLAMTTAPAFRFGHLFQQRDFRKKTSRSRTLLVALPSSLAHAGSMLQMLAAFNARSAGIKKLLVKKHPITTHQQVKALLRPWPRNFELIDGNFDDLLAGCDLLISGPSSVCLETLAKGKPVIVIGSTDGLTYHSIPASISEQFWKVCYNPSELARAVEFFIHRDNRQSALQKQQGKKIRETFFTPVTSSGIARLLQLKSE